jgi:hypothetical protein
MPTVSYPDGLTSREVEVLCLVAQGMTDPQIAEQLIIGSVFFLLGLIYFLIGLVGSFPSRNTLYAITNLRVVILRSGRNARISSFPKRAITGVQHIERPDGSGDLIFTSNPAYGRSGRVGAFSSLTDVRLVEQKLLRMLNEE